MYILFKGLQTYSGYRRLILGALTASAACGSFNLLIKPRHQLSQLDPLCGVRILVRWYVQAKVLSRREVCEPVESGLEDERMKLPL